MSDDDGAAPKPDAPWLEGLVDYYAVLAVAALAAESTRRGGWPPPEWIESHADAVAMRFSRANWPDAPALQALVRLILGRVTAVFLGAIIGALGSQTDLLAAAVAELQARQKLSAAFAELVRRN
jgi:hypothetical protein